MFQKDKKSILLLEAKQSTFLSHGLSLIIYVVVQRGQPIDSAQFSQ